MGGVNGLVHNIQWQRSNHDDGLSRGQSPLIPVHFSPCSHGTVQFRLVHHTKGWGRLLVGAVTVSLFNPPGTKPWLNFSIFHHSGVTLLFGHRIKTNKISKSPLHCEGSAL